MLRIISLKQDGVLEHLSLPKGWNLEHLLRRYWEERGVGRSPTLFANWLKQHGAGVASVEYLEVS